MKNLNILSVGRDLKPKYPKCMAKSLLLRQICLVRPFSDGFGGLVVSILASGTRVRGFKPGRSRFIFRAPGKSSVCLPSEGK